jgi:pSer/pThr/pTyr-binding forkhead associated (FHA) protein
MSLRLIIEDDEGTTTVVPLGADAITIGRQQGNTIQLTEKNVSRRHARLYPDQTAWVVEDLGSYNGVKVNAHKVEGRVVLQEGDVLQIGDYHLALTENVDKRTLNYDRPPEAANDVEPLLVSSSTDLPRLSPEELAALSSGPHTPQPAPMLDSGPVPAISSPHYAREQKSGSGVLVGVGVVVALALVLGGAWLVTSGNEPPETKVAENDKPQPAAAAHERADEEPTPVADEAHAIEEEQPPEPETSDDPENIVETDEIVDEDPPVAIEHVEIEPPKARAPKTPTTRPKKPPSTTQARSADTPPKPPPAPAVDADQLLADARSASMANQLAKAYELAKKSHKEKPSQDALNVMATAACKMGDAAKARFAIGKLSGKRKEDAKKLCEIKGVSL